MAGLGSGRQSHSSRICVEHWRVIDALRLVRQGILGPGGIGRQAWSSKAATGIVPRHLHYELYERWDGPVVRLSYDLQEIRGHMYYEIRLHRAAQAGRFSLVVPVSDGDQQPALRPPPAKALSTARREGVRTPPLLRSGLRELQNGRDTSRPAQGAKDS